MVFNEDFIDTDVLSIFSKIQQLPLLFTVFNIDCVNLTEILRTLWEREILMQPDVRKVITEIETKDNLKFRTTDPIFK